MKNTEIRAELFGAVSGWCKLRLLVMLVDAYPGALARDGVIARLWEPHARPARPEHSLRMTVAQTNKMLAASGARWRILRLNKGRVLTLVKVLYDA